MKIYKYVYEMGKIMTNQRKRFGLTYNFTGKCGYVLSFPKKSLANIYIKTLNIRCKSIVAIHSYNWCSLG